MRELTIIYENTLKMYSKLSIDLKGKEYLTRPKSINESIIDEAFLTINYHVLFIKEALYKITSQEVLVDAVVIENSLIFLEDIVYLEQKAQLLKSKLQFIQQSVYLYMVTLQSSVLLSRAKLMLKLEKESIERGLKVIVPRKVLVKHQSSFVQK